MFLGILLPSFACGPPHPLGWWRGLRLPSKLAACAFIFVLAGTAYVGGYATEHLRTSAIQRSAAGVALYMESFVGSYVQELANVPVLSEASTLALENLLSPASMHRSVVAFRIWKGDRIVFVNERPLLGKSFAPTPARRRAWQGEIGVEFDHPDGDDDSQIWALNLPILEVYAPLRDKSTGDIIAVVETYEIAVDLKKEIERTQSAAWLMVFLAAIAEALILFSIAKSVSRECQSLVAEVSRLRTESNRVRERISRAGLRVGAINEESLRRVGNALRDEAAQHIALALLKFDSLQELLANTAGSAPAGGEEYAEDLKGIQTALKESLGQIRIVAGNLLPGNFEELSVAEILVSAVHRHEALKGIPTELQVTGLPEQLQFPIKACLYRVTLEGLEGTCLASRTQSQEVRVACDHERIVFEILSKGDFPNDESDCLTAALELEELRHRVEAAGGELSISSTVSGQLSLIAELSFATDNEVARD